MYTATAVTVLQLCNPAALQCLIHGLFMSLQHTNSYLLSAAAASSYGPLLCMMPHANEFSDHLHVYTSSGKHKIVNNSEAKHDL